MRVFVHVSAWVERPAQGTQAGCHGVHKPMQWQFQAVPGAYMPDLLAYWLLMPSPSGCSCPCHRGLRSSLSLLYQKGDTGLCRFWTPTQISLALSAQPTTRRRAITWLWGGVSAPELMLEVHKPYYSEHSLTHRLSSGTFRKGPPVASADHRIAVAADVKNTSTFPGFTANQTFYLPTDISWVITRVQSFNDSDVPTAYNINTGFLLGPYNGSYTPGNGECPLPPSARVNFVPPP